MYKRYKPGLTKHLDDWMAIVDDGKQPVNQWTIKNVALLRRVLTHPDIRVDPERINECIELIEKYRPYKLAPVQRYIHAVISGIFWKDGRIAFRKILLYVARGFGKNSILSDASLYLLSNRHGIRDYNIDIVANNEKQAKTSFMDVYETIRLNPELDGAFSRTKTLIEFLNTSSELTYHTSNAKTKDGLRPGLVAFDEVEAYEDYSTIKVFTSALGKVPNPRTLILTTDGTVREGVLDDYLDSAKEVLDGTDDDIGFFPFLCNIDTFDEWETEEGWIKSNPMLPHLPVLMQEYHDSYKEAKKNQQLKLEFLTKRCNFPMVDQTTTPATHEELLTASEPLPDLKGATCIGAIDYAETSDFIGVGLLFKSGDKRYWMHHSFIMEESLKMGIINEDMLRLAESKGCYTVLPGKVADPEYIANWFVDKAKDYRIKKVVGDRFRIAIVKEAFQKAGVPLEEIPSGWVTHNKVAPVVTQLFGKNLLKWGDDPMMRWYTNNTKVVTDDKGNKTFRKIEAKRRKTDGFMALIHALSSESELANNDVKYYTKLKSYSY